MLRPNKQPFKIRPWNREKQIHIIAKEVVQAPLKALIIRQTSILSENKNRVRCSPRPANKSDTSSTSSFSIKLRLADNRLGCQIRNKHSWHHHNHNKEHIYAIDVHVLSTNYKKSDDFNSLLSRSAKLSFFWSSKTMRLLIAKQSQRQNLDYLSSTPCLVWCPSTSMRLDRVWSILPPSELLPLEGSSPKAGKMIKLNLIENVGITISWLTWMTMHKNIKYCY